MIEIIWIETIIHYCADNQAHAVPCVRDFEGAGTICSAYKLIILSKYKSERGPFRGPIKHRIRITIGPPIWTGFPR